MRGMRSRAGHTASVFLVGIRDADVNLQGDEAQAGGQHHVLGCAKRSCKMKVILHK
jgi:hypothetical protein